MTAATQGRLALAAAFATLLTSLTLAPLLQGAGWFAAVVVVVGAVAGVGAVARTWTRWWSLVVVVQVATLALCLTWLFARDVALFGLLPGPAVGRELHDLVQAGLDATRQEQPPVSASRAVILVVCGGIGLVGLAVDVIAATLHRPAVAGLPLLAVYCVPAAVLPGGLSWWYFVLAALGFLVLVGADSADRVRGWGRVLGQGGDEPSERALGGPLAGARRLAVGCVVVAALAPTLVPGLGERLLGGSGTGEGTGHNGNIKVINPILTLRDRLTARDDVVVIRYSTTAARPEPLRILSDEVFTGSRWEPLTRSVSRGNRVQNVMTPPPGLSSTVPVQEVSSQISVLDLHETYLPLPYPPRKVAVKGPWIYDPQSLNVVGDDGVTSENTTYTVDHLAVEPSVDQLRAAPPAPAPLQKAFTQLPPTLPALIAQTARRIGGTGTAYDQALALQQWLGDSGGFVYSETVDVPDERVASGQDAVASFLVNKHGYCVQFASAMAVMARSLGIPARVAVGFLPGRAVAGGRYEVSIKDAHAWPELYFGDVGWVRFEPTPARHAGDPPPYARPRTADAPVATATVTSTVPPTASAAAPSRRPDPQDAPRAAEPSLIHRLLDAVPWRWLAGLAALLLLVGVPLGVELAVRRARWRRAARGAPAVQVEAAWDELRERLEDLGVTWAASWTPRALHLRLVSDHGLPGSAQAALGRLVADLEHVRYAPPDGGGRGPAELRADVETVVQAVTASAAVRPWARRRARWLPTSGVRAIGSTLRRVDVAADTAGRRMSSFGADVRRRVGRRS